MIWKIYLIGLATCIATSCKQLKTNETFIVPPDTMLVANVIDSKNPPPPLPSRAYYFPSNFIIDTLGQVFYYQEEYKLNDDEQVDWSQPPKFINLRPQDIVQISDSFIEEFVYLNVLNRDSSKRYIAIASAKDTISSFGLSKIVAICKNNNYHIKWKFRIITNEEATVLGFKKRQEYYYPDEIKWDSAKIRMAPKVKEK